jgi:hypothetical protein
MSIFNGYKNFRDMPKEILKQISAMGGKAKPDATRGFSLSRETAKKAGMKGSKSKKRDMSKQPFSRDRDLAKRASAMGREKAHDARRFKKKQLILKMKMAVVAKQGRIEREKRFWEEQRKQLRKKSVP